MFRNKHERKRCAESEGVPEEVSAKKPKLSGDRFEVMYAPMQLLETGGMVCSMQVDLRGE